MPSRKILLRFQSKKIFANLQFFPPKTLRQNFKHEKTHLVKCLEFFSIYGKIEEGPIFVLQPAVFSTVMVFTDDFRKNFEKKNTADVVAFFTKKSMVNTEYFW